MKVEVKASQAAAQTPEPVPGGSALEVSFDAVKESVNTAAKDAKQSKLFIEDLGESFFKRQHAKLNDLVTPDAVATTNALGEEDGSLSPPTKTPEGEDPVEELRPKVGVGGVDDMITSASFVEEGPDRPVVEPPMDLPPGFDATTKAYGVGEEGDDIPMIEPPIERLIDLPIDLLRGFHEDKTAYGLPYLPYVEGQLPLSPPAEPIDIQVDDTPEPTAG